MEIQGKRNGMAGEIYAGAVGQRMRCMEKIMRTVEHETEKRKSRDYGTDSALPGDGYRADEWKSAEQDEQNAEQPWGTTESKVSVSGKFKRGSSGGSAVRRYSGGVSADKGE